jgi:hypothetical protein
LDAEEQPDDAPGEVDVDESAHEPLEDDLPDSEGGDGRAADQDGVEESVRILLEDRPSFGCNMSYTFNVVVVALLYGSHECTDSLHTSYLIS